MVPVPGFCDYLQRLKKLREVGWGKTIRDLKTNKIILKLILKFLGNQCNEAKMGEMGSYLQVPVKRPTAAF